MWLIHRPQESLWIVFSVNLWCCCLMSIFQAVRDSQHMSWEILNQPEAELSAQSPRLIRSVPSSASSQPLPRHLHLYTGTHFLLQREHPNMSLCWHIVRDDSVFKKKLAWSSKVIANFSLSSPPPSFSLLNSSTVYLPGQMPFQGRKDQWQAWVARLLAWLVVFSRDLPK